MTLFDTEVMFKKLNGLTDAHLGAENKRAFKFACLCDSLVILLRGVSE